MSSAQPEAWPTPPGALLGRWLRRLRRGVRSVLRSAVGTEIFECRSLPCACGNLCPQFPRGSSSFFCC